jgi:hypothetical protein
MKDYHSFRSRTIQTGKFGHAGRDLELSAVDPAA